MNFIHKILLFVICCIQFFYIQAREDFPDDPVMPVTDQLSLYKTVYKPLCCPEFDSNSHIVGLVPLVKMGYSYTMGLLRDDNNEDGQVLLRSFWQVTHKIIDEKNLSLSRYLQITLQLAHLLTDKRPKSYFFTIRNFQDCNWKNVFSLSPQVLPYPFCFQAVLFCKQGTFPLSLITDALLDGVSENVPVGLISLSVSAGGPHGGMVKDAVSLFTHDQGHFYAIFQYGEKNLDILNQLRSTLKRIRGSLPLARSDEAVMCMLLHEYPTIPNEIVQIPQMVIPEDKIAFAKEMGLILDGPFQGERNFFLSCVNLAIAEANLLIGYMDMYPATFLDTRKMMPFTVFGKQCDFQTNTQTASTETHHHFVMDYNVENQTIGTASIRMAYIKTNNPDFDDVTITDIGDIEFKEECCIPEQLQALFESPTITAKALNAELKKTIIGQNGPCISRDLLFREKFQDSQSILEYAQGENFLNPLTPSEIVVRLKSLYLEFYNRHKLLFN